MTRVFKSVNNQPVHQACVHVGGGLDLFLTGQARADGSLNGCLHAKASRQQNTRGKVNFEKALINPSQVQMN